MALLKSEFLVSVVVITYNQEKFIKKAIDSILEQETSFEVEIIIGDDNSTDLTREILKRYEEMNGRIRVIYRDENIGAIPNFIETFKEASGRYIALCEGDDYWLEPTKLQQQIDFLENNSTHSLVFHPVSVVFDDSKDESYTYPAEKSDFTVENLLRSNFIQTNSVVYRSLGKKVYRRLVSNLMPGDWYLHVFHAKYGEIGFIDKIMSVYRRHKDGLWRQDTEDYLDKIWINHGLGHLSLYEEMIKIYGNKKPYSDIIWGNITSLFNISKRIDERKGERLVDNLTKNKHTTAATLIGRLLDDNSRLSNESVSLSRELTDSKEIKDELEALLKQKSYELDAIKQSKAWKLAHFLGKFSRLGISEDK